MHMAAAIKHWTLDELHRLPDDGNKYELVRGELFVTPAPSVTHEMILARLSQLIEPFVANHRLGFVFHPRAVIRAQGSEAEPDLMVRPAAIPSTRDWERLPVPILVVEVLSGTTRRRDLGAKRDFYVDIGVAEYWIVDPKEKTVRVVRAGSADEVRTDEITWGPAGAATTLTIRIPELFE
jgi:Uma2 family endonuclease